jgi:hypothetical protein
MLSIYKNSKNVVISFWMIANSEEETCECMDWEMHGGINEYYCSVFGHMEAHYIRNFVFSFNGVYTANAAPAVTLKYFAAYCRCVAWLLAIWRRIVL